MLFIKKAELNKIADELFKIRASIKKDTKREEKLKKELLQMLDDNEIDEFYTEDYNIQKRVEDKETIIPKLFFGIVPKENFFKCCSINKQKASGFIGTNEISDISTTKPVIKLIVSPVEAHENIEVKQLEE